MTIEQLAAATLATPPASTFHSAPLRVLRDNNNNNNNMGASESVLRDFMASPQTERKMPKPQSPHSDYPKQHVHTSPRATAREMRKTSKPQAQPRPFNSPSQHVNKSPRVTAPGKHKTPERQSQSFISLMKQHVNSSPRATVQKKRKTPKPQSRPFKSLISMYTAV
jgi:superfamily I DNA/RNA helicase